MLDKDNVYTWLENCDPRDCDALKRFLNRLQRKENVGGLAHYADLLRLALLDHYGGIWTDATTMCFKPVNDWLPEALCLGMPHSLASNRRTETWFIDNRSKDPILTQWKTRYRDLYFSENNRITYLDDWSTKPHQISYWMLNLSMRGQGSAARVWNSKLALKWLKIRPYFATNAVLEYILRLETPRERMAKLHQLILPISSELMWELHICNWSQPMSSFAKSRIESAGLIKLNHKAKWADSIAGGNAEPNSAWATWVQLAGID